MNRQYYLSSRPDGMPTVDNVHLREVPIAAPGPSEVVLRNTYISLDPAIRGWMDDVPSYIEPIALDAVVRSSVLGRVVESRSEDYAVGDLAMGLGGWEDYSTLPADALNKVDDSFGIPLTHFLSVLGSSGLTAYFGLLRVADPQPGETVLVSAAAGGVGSVVGQIAKIKGCRAVGLAGSDEKCAYLCDELGFDAAINYKTAGDLVAAIQQACPQGVDVYFDNVGGDILDAALLCLSRFARVTLCGWISTYNRGAQSAASGPNNLWQLLVQSASMRGFTLMDYLGEFEQPVMELAQWMMEGKLQFREEIVEGLDQVFPTFLRLFDGSHQGKLIVSLPE